MPIHEPKLEEYNRKRDFTLTHEPRGLVKLRQFNSLQFVVQEHEATRLHYDFRLELNGVFKSWSVPKGLPLETSVKRLAIATEDHPLDYKTFEGVIPEGSYGAGTVIIWDSGTYHAETTKNRNLSQKILSEEYNRGKMVFVLAGKKLRGTYTLIKIENKPPHDSWILFKNETDDTRMPGIASYSKQKSEAPRFIKPMLATLVDSPFDRSGWFFELKFDGYRTIADIADGSVRLYSRNQKILNRRYPAVVEALKNVSRQAILDGEIVALNQNGIPEFQLLQNYGNRSDVPLVYYIFDILYLDGYDQTQKHLRERKRLLKYILPDDPHLRYSEYIEGYGLDLFRKAQDLGYEGVIAKNSTSMYEAGTRSAEWLKVKTSDRQEVVIAGYTEPQNSRKYFGSLVMGVYENGTLSYVGNVGTGFTENSLHAVYDKLKSLVIRESPFTKDPETTASATWVTPELIAEIKFSGWTRDGIMRQPVFLGLRSDKYPGNVIRETPKKAVLYAQAGPGEQHKAGPKLTNLSKLYWPELGLTKGDMISYYETVSEYILPYLYNRPQILNRFPNGIHGTNFYQKNMTIKTPDWITTKVIPSADGTDIRYVIIDSHDSLLYLANLGCIEFNPFTARADLLTKPDYAVIDLDPEQTDFTHVLRAALAVKQILDAGGVESFPKTSGKRGLHIFIPLGAKYDVSVVRQFTELIATLARDHIPDCECSLERSPLRRQGKVYLDFLQNKVGSSVVSPYSLRPTVQASVSTPLTWDEVTESLNPAQFTIYTVPQRLSTKGDVWDNMLHQETDLLRTLELLRVM